MRTLKFGIPGMLFIAMLLSVNTNIFAQRGYGQRYGQGQGYGQGFQSGYFCNNIPNLTTEQQTKITGLRTVHWKERQNFINQLAEKGVRLQILRSTDNVDMQAINNSIDELGVIQTNMLKNKEQHFQSVRAVLTDDQKVFFNNFNRGRANGQGYGYGNGYGRGRGSGRCFRGW